ncbi:MAG TPA: hypothetical protein VGN74_05595 [Brevundimonas sp.]|jgi:hypothetical protein|uniref:hypothetical protein n=1 Tax=Brevundimonas sp. TaxID=1871086 RepID=UPI002E109811|nr:hypothetical protein [Brevundimonas sp.]
MPNRLDEIKASRRQTPPPVFDDKMLNALVRLTSHPEWDDLLAYFGERIDGETVDRAAPNVSALLMIEGRRTLFAELKKLREKVNDDRRRREPDE